MEDPPLFIFKVFEGDEYFMVTFRLKDEKVDREFNFSRKITESATDFLGVISHKIDKIKEKKSKKKKMNQEIKLEPSPVFFLQDKEKIDIINENALDLLSQKSISMDICGSIFTVRKNPPFVETLKLSDRIMVDFPCYPSKFEMSFGTRESSIFNWYTSESSQTQKKWTLVKGTVFLYTPSSNDVGRFVKLEVIPRDGNQTAGRTVEIVSKNAVDPGPGYCPFQRRHEYTDSITNESTCRVVSYNLLADLYADSVYSRTVLFPSCPPFALSLDYRKQMILRELKGYHGDIICLQEVDRKVFKYDLLPILSEVGFNGVFETKGGDLSEGLACFWRESKFDLLNSQVNVINEMLKGNDETWNDLRNAIQAKPELKESIMKRKTAFLTVLLQPKNTSGTKKPPLLIGITHLLFLPEADHIRLIQAEICLRHMCKLLKETHGHLIFCGDFNSVPTNAVYEYFLGGKITTNHADWKSCPSQEVEGINLSHNLSLESGCGTPKYTNYTLKFKDCLDYVFFDTRAFSVDKVIPFPTIEELGEAIPNPHFPSDHIACVVDLKWKV
ncbi:LOW QUALITY PROTEIN: 2',5'-phosphodiesterase 12 [Lepeophtheirus salmonis]|uniref:LOW QUALITY PROTEIN: 2',5'-phosphodiesterase 12 n=1 Tax=Lepeophtheirus salmonis TaxID=72036 RepID=UPI001AEB2DD4|nr:LOW QUALITY PROTEIN: 2',5'-phosphodiesterase 12-like [Lepeophtheirus salmonis]